LKSSQKCSWLVGEEDRAVTGQIPVRGWQGVEKEMVSEHQELTAHLLGAWGREGDDRRWGSHGGRGGGGGVLVGEKVPVR
jgi:hypothetical protein